LDQINIIPRSVEVEIIAIKFGGDKIVDSLVLERFQSVIRNGETIEINSTNLSVVGNPIGKRRNFFIEYRNGKAEDFDKDHYNKLNFRKFRRAMENEKLDFSWDITYAEYGIAPWVWPMVGEYVSGYEKLFWALDHKESVRVEDRLAGFCPTFESDLKTMKVTYANGSNVYHTSAVEGAELRFPERK
jgi:hypothetical protein